MRIVQTRTRSNNLRREDSLAARISLPIACITKQCVFLLGPRVRTTTYRTIHLRFLAYLDQQIADLDSQLRAPFEGQERHQATELAAELRDRRSYIESRLKSLRRDHA